MLGDLEGRINVNAEYQRGIVWTEPQRQFLIDSILRRYDLPKIFLRKLPDGSQFLFDVVDGVQRLTAIWQFLSDDFCLPRSYRYPDLDNVAGRGWSELPQNAKDRIQFAKVTVTELETVDEAEIREMFQRLQQGEPLNPAEKRNALDVPVRDFVAKRLALHPVWPQTGINKRRMAWHEMSAIVLAIVRAGDAIGLKGVDLQGLYEEIEFDSKGDVATLAVEWLDQLCEIAAVAPGTLRTRWGVVDLLLALMRFAEGEVMPSPVNVMGFFVEFEKERRTVAAALSDLRSTVMGLSASDLDTELRLQLTDINADMLTYVNAFTREGATRDNVKTRAEIMYSRLRTYLRRI